LDNFFAEFDLAESAALLSCFIFQEKSQNEPALTSNLEKVYFKYILKYIKFYNIYNYIKFFSFFKKIYVNNRVLLE